MDQRKQEFWTIDQIAKLSHYVAQMEDLLEHIINLHVTTPEDDISKEFNKAGIALEEGHSRMVAILAKLKGMKTDYEFTSPDVVKKIVETSPKDKDQN